jgi:hypothetical protein
VEKQTRISAGFRSVEEINTPTCNLATITLTSQFEKNRKWIRNNECNLIVVVVKGIIGVQIGNENYTEISGKNKSRIYIFQKASYTGGLSMVVEVSC